MLVLENLLTRAADTSDDTWLDRFAGTTYDDLVALQGGSPTDARKALARKYDDKAQELLAKWDAFQTELLNYDENVETVENFDEHKAEKTAEALENLDI